MSSFGTPGSEPNPYSSPMSSYAPGYGAGSGAGDGNVTMRTVEMLRQTKPWVRTMSVLGFILGGLMVLASLAMIVVGTLGRGGPEAFVGLVYIPIALLYFAPSLFLWRYADSIKNLLFARSVVHLEDALQHQKSFWKFMAITALVGIALYVLVLGLLIGGVGLMAVRQGGR